MAFPFMKTICGFAAFAVLSVMQISSAHAERAVEPEAPQQLKVTVDRAKVVRLDRAADTVIVGNPMIVDATIQDSRTIVLTGRSYGVTNLIVLDSLGEPIVDETLIVQTHEENVVRIYRRASRETLACSPVCERTLTIGDNAEQFDAVRTQIENRNAASEPKQ